MNTVTLGMTGLQVTPIAYGTWQFGGDWGKVDEAAAIRAIRTARELGVNIFDTARAYGFGVSERILGQALREELRAERDRLVIATKGGMRIVEGELRRDSSPTALREDLDNSLRDLELDYVDLYQIHWPDPDTPFAESAAARSSATFCPTASSTTSVCSRTDHSPMVYSADG